MRLFTTRARRPDRPPAVRSLDLAAVALARGVVPARATGVDPAIDLDRIAAELARASGIPIGIEPVACGDLERSCRATVRAGDRYVTVGLDRAARRAWLGLVLGLPAGRPEEGELPEEPTRLERAVLERTLVRPLACIAGDAGPVEWKAVPSGTVVSRAATRVVRCTAAGAAGTFQLVIASETAAGIGGEPDAPAIDRLLESSVLPLVVRLDPRRAGVTLRAAELARLEPGDVLVTDLPADRSGGLPVEAAGGSDASSGGGSFLLEGRLGVSGGRRGVRFTAIESVRSCDR